MVFREPKMFPKAARMELKSCLEQADPELNGAIMEIGSWEGLSTIEIARHFSDSNVHVVDHWRGDLFDPSSYLARWAAARDVFADFKQNCKDAGVLDRLVIHRDDWRNAVMDWNDTLMFLFIDAEHTYIEVSDQIKWAMKFVVPGTVICGDDYHLKPVKRAVEELLPDAGFAPLKKNGRVWYWKQGL